jgi:hypothetical protein
VLVESWPIALAQRSARRSPSGSVLSVIGKTAVYATYPQKAPERIEIFLLAKGVHVFRLDKSTQEPHWNVSACQDVNDGQIAGCGAEEFLGGLFGKWA